MHSSLFAIGGLAVGIAGVGLSAYSMMQQGGTQASIAGQNADIIRANAEIDRRAAEINALGEIEAARIDKLNAGLSLRGGKIDEQNAILSGVAAEFMTAATVDNLAMDSRMARVDSRISRKNASTLISFARQIEGEGRERITRLRSEGAKAMGIVRNRVAKSGIVMEGSPLAVAAETAGNIEFAAQDVNYEARSAARGTRKSARNELLQSRRSILEGRQARKSAKNAIDSLELSKIGTEFQIAGTKLTQEAATYAGEAADFREAMGYELMDLAEDRYELDLKSAGITQAAGIANARATQLASYGTLLSGGADLASNAAKLIPTS